MQYCTSAVFMIAWILDHRAWWLLLWVNVTGQRWHLVDVPPWKCVHVIHRLWQVGWLYSHLYRCSWPRWAL